MHLRRRGLRPLSEAQNLGSFRGRELQGGRWLHTLAPQLDRIVGHEPSRVGEQLVLVLVENSFELLLLPYARTALTLSAHDEARGAHMGQRLAHLFV